MKEKVAEEMSERRKKPELKSLRRWTWLEVGLWLTITPFYILTENWAAVVLIVVVLTKISIIYQYRKLLIELHNIVDSILYILKGSSGKRGNK